MHLVHQLISYLFVVQTLIGAEETDDIKQIERRRRSSCERRMCPQPIAMEMTSLILQQLCHALTDQNVPLIQGGIITECATFASTVYDGQAGRCVRNEPKPYFVGLYPFLAQNVQCADVTVLSTFFEDDGKVIVKSNSTTVAGPFEQVFKLWCTFEPVSEGSCIYKLTEQKVVSYQCI